MHGEILRFSPDICTKIALRFHCVVILPLAVHIGALGAAAMVGNEKEEDLVLVCDHCHLLSRAVTSLAKDTPPPASMDQEWMPSAACIISEASLRTWPCLREERMALTLPGLDQ